MSGRRQFKLVVEDEQYGGRQEELYAGPSLEDIREFVNGKAGAGTGGDEEW